MFRQFHSFNKKNSFSSAVSLVVSFHKLTFGKVSSKKVGETKIGTTQKALLKLEPKFWKIALYGVRTIVAYPAHCCV